VAPSQHFDPTAQWTAPKNSGVLEVDPDELYSAATKIATLRESFITTVHRLTGTLAADCGNMAGTDIVAAFFANFYDPLADDAVKAAGDLMDSVGGVPEGLVVSANNYAAADAAATPGAPSPAARPVPRYGAETFSRPAPSSGGSYLSYHSVSLTVESLASQAAHNPFKLITDLLPTGHQDRLTTAAGALNDLSAQIDELAQNLNAVLTTLTVDSSATSTPRTGQYPGVLNTSQVNTWQTAMSRYCSLIWGWAQAKYGGAGLPNHPLGLAGVAAGELAELCKLHCDAINTTRSALERQLGAAGLAKLIGLATSEVTVGLSDLIAETFDEEALIQCATILIIEYADPIQRGATALGAMNLDVQLAKALAVAPTMAAIEAQSESIGDRSVHDFQYTGLKAPGSTPSKWGPGYSNKQNSGHPPTSVLYPVDLAGQEGTSSSHVISVHVGKTDAQLLARMSNSSADGSGSFPTVATAQTAVQADLSAPANEQTITTWVNQCQNLPPGAKPPPLPITLQTGSVTGRTVVGSPGNYQVENADGVESVLVYNADLNPPFIVSTAYPVK
jgi:hypothetical protein